MIRISLLGICLSIFTMSCGAKSSTVSTPPPKQTTVTEVNPSCLDLGPGLRMKQVTDIGAPLSNKNRLPMDYKAYVIEEKELEDYMNPKNRLNKRFSLTFPLFEGCITFDLKNSGTMSPELMEKYPDIQSFRGINENQYTADVDYSGKELKAKINTQDNIYIFEPIVTEKGKFYILYLLRNSGYPKTIRK